MDREESWSFGTKPCSTCCEPIRACAKKCVHCDSYQDWRRHLAASSATIALIVSVIAVAVASVPVIFQALRKSDSNLNVVSRPYLGNGHMYISVANLGKKAGTVDVVTLYLPTEQGDEQKIWLHLMRQDASTEIIPGDSLRGLDYKAQFPTTALVKGAWNPLCYSRPQLELQKEMLKAHKCCCITLATTSYSGEQKPLSREIGSGAVQQLIQHYWDDAHHPLPLGEQSTLCPYPPEQ